MTTIETIQVTPSNFIGLAAKYVSCEVAGDPGSSLFHFSKGIPENTEVQRLAIEYIESLIESNSYLCKNLDAEIEGCIDQVELLRKKYDNVSKKINKYKQSNPDPSEEEDPLFKMMTKLELLNFHIADAEALTSELEVQRDEARNEELELAGMLSYLRMVRPLEEIMADLDEFTKTFIECAIETEFWKDDEDEVGYCYGDRGYSAAHFSPATLSLIRSECEQFQKEFGHLFQLENVRVGSNLDGSIISKAAADFWITRTGNDTVFGTGDWIEGVDEVLFHAAKKYGRADIDLDLDGWIYFENKSKYEAVLGGEESQPVAPKIG